MTWIKKQEFELDLQALPKVLQDAAREMLQTAADNTQRKTKAGYPVKTGFMRDHVNQYTEEDTGKLTIRVKSESPAAHLWEHGTVVRETKKGANRGQVQPHVEHSIHAIGDAERELLNAKLATLIESHGFTLSGHTAA